MGSNFSIAKSAVACKDNAIHLMVLATFAVALMLPPAGQAAQPAGATENKVVFQVSDPDPKKWNLALNNVKNVQEAFGKDKVTVEVVVYGPGIGMLKMDSEAGNRVNDAVANGVKIVACENTMHGMKLTRKDMLDSISYVPGGVIELMDKQKQGYAYIRP